MIPSCRPPLLPLLLLGCYLLLALTSSSTTSSSSLLLSVHGASCAVGHFCYNSTFTTADYVPCMPSQYCPGNQAGQVCAKGYYCPDPTQQLICPEGNYCPPASIVPRPCSGVAACKEGSYRYFNWGCLLLLLILIPLAIAAPYLYRIYLSRYGKATTPTVLAPTGKPLTAGEQAALEMDELNYDPNAPARRRPPPVPAQYQPRVTKVSGRASIIVDRTADDQSVPKMDIKFTNLQAAVMLSGVEKIILEDVSGHFRSGRLIAVMGPSGAGKSSLINVLTGNVKLKSGTIETRIEGGLEDDLRRTRNLGLIGVVPQADIMIPCLSPHDILTHSAFTRLPRNWAKDKKEQRVATTLRRLGLEKVKYTPVGDEEVRGVSGGEKKRVNIGIELVNEPSLLILDEPTTGLDSTSSQTLLTTLREITWTGTTVVAVLHQPRGEIFRGLDDLLLLAPGGRTVFFGPAADTQKYFESIGYKCDSNTNIADFFIDVIAGKAGSPFAPQKVVKDGFTSVVAQSDSSTQEAFKHNGKLVTTADEIQTYLVESWKGEKGNTYRAEAALNQPGDMAYEAVRFESTVLLPTQLQLTYLYFYRGCLQLWRSLGIVQLELMMHIMCGLIIGMAFVDENWFIPPINPGYVKYCPEPMQRSCREDAIHDVLALMTTYTSMALGLVTAIIGNRCYGQEILNMHREASSGLSPAAYFWGKAFSDLPFIIVYSFLYCVSYYLVASPGSKFNQFYTAILMFEFVMFSVGYFASLALGGDNAFLLSAISALLAGLATDNKSMEKNLCWARWLSEALYVSDVRVDLLGPPIDDIVQIYMDLRNGFHLSNYSTCIGILFVMGMCLRGLSYGLVWRKFRQ